MMQIPLSNPDITARERRAVMDVLKTPNLSLGPTLPEFERMGAAVAGRKYAVAVNSGTSGLHLIVKALGIGRGDVVITTPFSFIASANCVLFEHAVPVFADIDPLTMNIDPESVEQMIREHGVDRVKAILAVDVFGHPAEWDALTRISRRYNVKLIEDSCEAIGAQYRSPDSNGAVFKTARPAGSFGDAGVFAFYPNKQMTTGEGGLIVTDSKRMAALCRSWRNQGRGEGAAWLNHLRLGYNYRLSDINCALGVTQLERLGEILARRDQVARRYTRLLQNVVGIHVPQVLPHVTMSWFVYVVRLADGYRRRDRDAIMRYLQQQGVACSNYFAPIHLQPFFRREFGYRRGTFPVTEHVADRTIALPFFSRLRASQARYVVDVLQAALRR